MAYLPNPFGYGTQCHRAYEALKMGPVSSVELRGVGAFNHTARTSEIRKRIRPHGWDVVREKLGGRLYSYRLVRLPEEKEEKTVPGFWGWLRGKFRKDERG